MEKTDPAATAPAEGGAMTVFLPPGVHPALRGKPFFPCSADKRPAFDLLPKSPEGKPTWAPFRKRLATPEEMTRWKGHPGPWGMPCGALSGFVVLDFDVPEGPKLYEAKYDGAELPPTAMTPRGGYHALHAYQEGITVPNDVKLIPGLDVRSEGGYVIIPSAYQDGRTWTIPPDKPAPPLPIWFLSCLNKPTTPAGQVVGASDGLPAGVGQGERNQAAARHAGKYLGPPKWLTPEETFHLLRPWAAKCTPPLPEAELRSVIFSIARKEADKTPLIELVDSSELSRLAGTPREKIIDPFLSAGSKNILAGWQGSYKSTALLNMAVCIRNGLPLFGRFDCKQGRVLYIDRENNPELTNLRVEKIARGIRGAGGGITFQFPKEKPDLADKRVREAYIRTIEKEKIDLAIFDSFLCFFNLRNENDNTEVRGVLEQVSEIPARTGAAILFIDHAGKASPEKAKAGIRVTPRGASAKGDWADMVMTIEEREDEARKLRLIRFSKTRYNLPLPPMLLEVGTDLVFVPSGIDEICPVFTVRQTVDDKPGIGATELYTALMKATGCGKRTAITSTGRAVELGFIRRHGNTKPVNYYPAFIREIGDCTNNEDTESKEGKLLEYQ
ncbi:MAG: AAA family ATPase [Desulfobacteria bacterium]